MILEMIKCHNMADVFFAAKTLRNYKPNMVETLVSTRPSLSTLAAGPGMEERCWGCSPPTTPPFPPQILMSLVGILTPAPCWDGLGSEAAPQSSLGLVFILLCQRGLSQCWDCWKSSPGVVRQSHIHPRDAAVVLWKVCGVGSSSGVELDKFLLEI